MILKYVKGHHIWHLHSNKHHLPDFNRQVIVIIHTQIHNAGTVLKFLLIDYPFRQHCQPPIHYSLSLSRFGTVVFLHLRVPPRISSLLWGYPSPSLSLSIHRSDQRLDKNTVHFSSTLPHLFTSFLIAKFSVLGNEPCCSWITSASFRFLISRESASKSCANSPLLHVIDSRRSFCLFSSYFGGFRFIH